MKAIGGFTSELHRAAKESQVPVGSTVLLEGPYGNPSVVFHRYHSVTLVAGGIGITPMISMFGYLAKNEPQISTHLIWCVRTHAGLLLFVL